MLGPVSNEDEGAGSGTRCVRALSLVTCVRAAGARLCGDMVALSRLCGYVGYPGGSTSAAGRVGVFPGGSQGS